MNIDYIRKQIKWIIEQIQCIKKRPCNCPESSTPYNLGVALTDSTFGDNGYETITYNPEVLSFFNLQFDVLVNNENTTISIKESYLNSLKDVYSMDKQGTTLMFLKNGQVVFSTEI